MTDIPLSYPELIDRSWQALRMGDRRTARHLAEQALALRSDKEEPWLILAAIASPQASISYLEKALEINPHSQAALQGLEWAKARQEASPEGMQSTGRQVPVQAVASHQIIRPRYRFIPVLLLLMLVLIGLGFWYSIPRITSAGFFEPTVPAQSVSMPQVTTPFQSSPDDVEGNLVAQPSPAAPEVQVILLPIMPKDDVVIPIAGPAEATEEFVADAPQVMDTPTPTEEPTQVAAEQPKKKKKNKTAKANAQPPNPEAEGRWIEVDLSDQRTYAYQNNELVRSFVVSTGTWQHPTVTGSYRIYVKYRAADMSGPDYYLPDVPYVMYFYKGYGLHGTYWHNNFGTPMSHGCVNLPTDDAAWLFDFASVGTLVQVHQ